MKFLLALSILICSSFSFSQDYYDTIVYKTGVVRVGEIIKEGNAAIKYNYYGTGGRVMTTSARISMLESYTIDGVKNGLEPEFNASNLGYNDTIYFKSGEVRVGNIYKETNVGIRYNFVNVDGKISNTMTRKGMLNSYVVGDKESSVASDWESKNVVDLEQREQSKKNGNMAIVGIIGGIAVAVLAGLVTVLVFLV